MGNNTSLDVKTDPSQTVCICTAETKATTLIVGFPGHGLVGSISAKYIVKELDLKVTGYIRSPLIPPLAVFLDGVLAYPYRIYSSPEVEIAVLIGESPAPVNAYYYIANAVLDWGVTVGAKEVICLDGFADASTREQLVYLVAEPDMKEKVDEIDLPRPQTGYIGGLAGAVLNESILRAIDGYALLVSTPGQLPDPIGAAKLIKVLNELKNIKINCDSLIEDGEKIKNSMQEFADRTRQLTDSSSLDDKSSLYI
ncbi:MAG: proteasome assembly chaperone family protein [Candidatus Hodarchaeales archaeon]|jgi:uncharacterized protein